MKKIYCISGLGADERIFNKLELPGYELILLPWLPYDNRYTLPAYASKLAKEITEENAIILGVSFGGMLATEMAKVKYHWRVFIISSARISKDIKWKTRINETIIKWKIIPTGLFNIPSFFQLKLLGAETHEEKNLLKDIIRKSDSGFVRWSIQALLTWRNEIQPKNVVHIHGTNDKMLMPKYCMPNEWIKNGSHLMVYNKANEVSEILLNYLNGNTP